MKAVAPTLTAADWTSCIYDRCAEGIQWRNNLYLAPIRSKYD